MKTQVASSPTDFVETENSVTLSKRRMDGAVQAACEIEELALVLATCMPRGDNWLAIRGIAARIIALSRISMSALSDSAHPTDDLLFRLTLERGEVAA